MRFLSLRRHDPDQVVEGHRAACAYRYLSPLPGHPLERVTCCDGWQSESIDDSRSIALAVPWHFRKNFGRMRDANEAKGFLWNIQPAGSCSLPKNNG